MKPNKFTQILFAFVLGALLGINIKYPVKQEDVDQIKTICTDGKYERFKVGITGKIYEIECDSMDRIRIKKPD